MQRRRVVIKEYIILRGVAKGGGTNGVEFKGQRNLQQTEYIKREEPRSTDFKLLSQIKGKLINYRDFVRFT